MKIKLDLAYSVLDFEDRPDLLNDINLAFRHRIGFREEGYIYSPAYKGGHWDGYVAFHEVYKIGETPYIKYPTGLTDEVDEVLGSLQSSHGFEYSIFDNRPDPMLSLEDVPDEVVLKSYASGDITLRDYQMESVYEVAKQQVGVLHLATNSGKTMTAAAIIKMASEQLLKGERIAFMTHSSAIFNQVHKELTESLGVRIGKYGGGKKDIQKITVCMIPTLQAALTVNPEVGLKLTPKERLTKRIAKDVVPKFESGINQRMLLRSFVMNYTKKTKTDEKFIEELEDIIYTCGTDAQVKFKLKSYAASYNKIIETKNKEAYQKLKEVKEYLDSIVAVVGDECHHVKSDSYYNVFMNCPNAIVKVGLTGSIDKKDKMLTKRMKGVFHRTLTRISNDALINRDISAKPQIIITPITQVISNGTMINVESERDYMRAYDKAIVNNEYRNTVIAKITEMCYNDGEGVLLIVNRIDHGENIGAILEHLNIPYEFITGDHDMDVRENSFNAMKAGHLKVLISTSLIDEGVDINGINSLVLCAGGKSLRQVLQRVGRVLRKKKIGANTAKVYDFSDETNKYMWDHANIREKIYLEEQFEITKI